LRPPQARKSKLLSQVTPFQFRRWTHTLKRRNKKRTQTVPTEPQAVIPKKEKRVSVGVKKDAKKPDSQGKAKAQTKPRKSKLKSSSKLFTRFVEIGRICFIRFGNNTGRLCTIIGIVNPFRVLIDGPRRLTHVPRIPMALKRLELLKWKIDVRPNAGEKELMEAWEKNSILDKWFASKMYYDRVYERKRAKFGDFDRYKLFIAKHGRRVLFEHAMLRLKRLPLNQLNRVLVGKQRLKPKAFEEAQKRRKIKTEKRANWYKKTHAVKEPGELWERGKKGQKKTAKPEAPKAVKAKPEAPKGGKGKPEAPKGGKGKPEAPKAGKAKPKAQTQEKTTKGKKPAKTPAKDE